MDAGGRATQDAQAEGARRAGEGVYVGTCISSSLARSARRMHRLYLGHGAQVRAVHPTASLIPSAPCTMANSVAKVLNNDANLVLASPAFAVKLRGLFSGRLSASAAPA